MVIKIFAAGSLIINDQTWPSLCLQMYYLFAKILEGSFHGTKLNIVSLIVFE